MASGAAPALGRRSASGSQPALRIPASTRSARPPLAGTRRCLRPRRRRHVEVGRESQLLRPQLAEPDHGERQVRPGGLDRVRTTRSATAESSAPVSVSSCELARRVASRHRTSSAFASPGSASLSWRARAPARPPAGRSRTSWSDRMGQTTSRRRIVRVASATRSSPALAATTRRGARAHGRIRGERERRRYDGEDVGEHLPEARRGSTSPASTSYEAAGLPNPNPASSSCVASRSLPGRGRGAGERLSNGR